MTFPKQFSVSLPVEVAAAVEKWRLAQVVPPSRSAALAAFVAAGMRVLLPASSAAVGPSVEPDPPLLARMGPS